MKKYKDHRGSTDEERKRWHEWGVSEVIGVVLLLSLVVVGGTVVGTQLLSQPATKEIPSVNFLANYDSGQNYTTLYHTGGDTLRAGDYHFVVQYSGTSRPVTVKPTSDWQSGQRLPLPDASGEPYKVTLVYTGKGAGETALRSVVIGDMGRENSGQPVNPPAEGGATTFTITATASTGGLIDPNGIWMVNAGASQSFTITPNQNYHILDLQDNGQSQGAVSTYPLTNIQEDHTIIVSFAHNIIQNHIIRASAGPNGTVNPSGEVSVPNARSQAFIFNSETGFHLDTVKVDTDTVTTIGNTYTFTNVISDHDITATFEKNQYNITATAGDGGMISPPGKTVLNYGDSQIYTIMPSDGYTIDDVVVDGNSVDQVSSSYTFPQVNANHTIKAIFISNGQGDYSIEGNVWNDLTGEGKPESHGTGLQGWIITVSIDNGQNAGLLRSLVTNQTGYYKFDNLPKGHYKVVETALIGWDETYPAKHNGAYIIELNDGEFEKHQEVKNIDFLNKQILGSYIPGTDFYLQASRPGYLVQGGYISFTVTGLDSWADIKGNDGTVNRYLLNVGDTATIELTSNSTISKIDAHSLTNPSGQLDSQSLEIDGLILTAVNLYKNGNLVATGSMDGSSNIYIRSCSNYQSTLTLRVPAPIKGLDLWDQLRFSTFKVDNTWVVKQENPYQFNDWEYVIYNLKPSSSAQFHLNSNAQSLGEFYGGGSGYQMVGTS